MRVEQELERAVRLRAEGDLGSEQEHLALAELALRRRRCRPRGNAGPTPSLSAAASLSSNHATVLTPLIAAFGASSITGLLSKNTSTFFSKPKASGIGVVDRDLQDDAGNVVLRAGQRPLGAVLRDLDEVIADRQAEVMTEHRGATERDDHAAGFRELLQLRHGLLDARRGRDARDIPRAFIRRRLAAAAEAAATAVGSRECRRRGRGSRRTST